jgi:hypothetical protein
MLCTFFIDKILDHNPTYHCSKQICEGMEIKTKANIYYEITLATGAYNMDEMFSMEGF